MGIELGFDLAVRASVFLLGFALLQASLEHMMGAAPDRRLFDIRAGLCVLLLLGVWTPFALLGLFAIGLILLHRFDGPYNGGADRMGLLVIACLCAVHWLPSGQAREIAFGYLGLQLVLSYFISGWVKIINPDWRTGRALADVFLFSAYPVSEGLRSLAARRALLTGAAWTVMVFELAFPLTLLTQTSLLIGLALAAAFHLANACLFGLNRFFWIWLAAYPSILWLQGRVF